MTGYRLLADGLVLAHLAYIVFAVAGGLLLWWRPRIAWLHLPAVGWAALVELAGWYCPLTPWEQRLRQLGGLEGYEGDFVGHYILPVIYPAALTREMQLAMGAGVALLNLAVYGYWLRRLRVC
ncbi:MAG: DUF2784 family protein [Candidatus Latescibacteria bacterium]|nr:DUF2784 family protein [Candidatus Latescibacterota bacterium]